MYPKFRKYFFPADEEQSIISHDKAPDYQTRFKWVDSENNNTEEFMEKRNISEEMLWAEAEIGNCIHTICS